jgi:hypothetical protein
VLFTDWQLKVIMMRNAHDLMKSRVFAGTSLVSLLVVALAARSTHLIGSIPGCPVKALVGIDCPACGSVRCVEALASGQMGSALDQNLLTSLLLAVGTIFLILWLVVGPKFWEKLDIQRLLQSVAVVTLVFWASRLAPWEVGEWLSSGMYHQ